MAHVVKLEPGDVLVISNIGAVTDDLNGAVRVLRETLGLAAVIGFKGDPDLSRLKVDNSDAVAGG
jgi:hypothetical protein